MRVPLSWLAEYVDLPGDATPDSVMAELVKVGFEEEASHSFDVTGPVVVGQVLEFTDEPQSNGKTIRWCSVRVAPEGQKAADGGADVRGIVCGASNFEVGDKVVVCLPGTVLPGDFAIAARSTYGHISDGMMASAKELSLNDDHGGIIRLHEMGLDPKVGASAIELLNLADTAAEINVTPDRGYCFSIRGVAREYAHATGSEFRDPTGNVQPEVAGGFEVSVNDATGIRDKVGCDRFVLRAVRGVDATKPTPPWMIARLKLAGMRSISLVVDITNYVMLELGQPIHAYDLDRLSGGIVVRRASAGETLKTLDGQVRKLHVEDLLITDGSGPIGLAGVMGGETTEVSNSTVNVIIEGAHFDPISIARSARRHKLISEASKRFERGVDPRVAEYAVARVIQLLEVHAGGSADGLGANYSTLGDPSAIWLPAEFAQEITGVEYTVDEVTGVLADIGCVVAHVDGGYEVIAPSWRPDLTHKTDLAEEIARIVGYERIGTRLPVAPPGRGLTKNQKLRRSVLAAAVGAGATEVLTYPFVSEEANGFFSDAKTKVILANPMQVESGQLRLTILSGLVDAARRNLSRGLTDLSIFEEGSVFIPTSKSGKAFVLPGASERPTAEVLDSVMATLPAQPKHFAALLTGDRVKQQVGVVSQSFDYSDAISLAARVVSATGQELTVRQGTAKGYHPGRTAELFIGKNSIGFAGELAPALASEKDLPRRVAILEINLDVLYASAPDVRQAAPIFGYPAATQDLSLLVGIDVPAGDVLRVIEEGSGALLEQVRLLEDYRGANLPEGQKSLTFALRFRATDRTLTQVEASEARDVAVALAGKQFGATIRA
ncbi:MAG: phenylalanine--tRNA ligase subunit beta [Actinobacteria bacterium]|uniref:Phenylalanine--tRNA ligase beta subunit n=1 Tax=freshwater metagenome TaxID=449393 RepID=A0A6J6GNN8_9ZZZZ|nr:phenylalanine--tRNA ligase subunit beta [Actinomycetota bacterium]